MIKLDSNKINVFIDNKLINIKIPSLMQTKKLDVERGGVLIGKIYPASNTIVITDMYESKKAKATRYNIEINHKEIQSIINSVHKLSSGHLNYLGDWHTHPESTPLPSYTDKNTFKNRMEDSILSKNILLNMIIGNDISKDFLFIEYIENTLLSKKISYSVLKR